MKRAALCAAWLLVAAVVAAALTAFAGVGFWWALAIVAGALLINGWMATLEDDLPSGFNNPDGKSTPRYATITGWAVHGVGALAALFCLGMLGLYFFASR